VVLHGKIFKLLHADFLRPLFEIVEFIPLHTEGVAFEG
jgi:hypothetical protein